MGEGPPNPPDTPRDLLLWMKFLLIVRNLPSRSMHQLLLVCSGASRVWSLRLKGRVEVGGKRKTAEAHAIFYPENKLHGVSSASGRPQEVTGHPEHGRVERMEGNCKEVARRLWGEWAEASLTLLTSRVGSVDLTEVVFFIHHRTCLIKTIKTGFMM